ncbi:hypothetical protein BDD12DRAFT_895760 [Trichophaea hybrida]|nr:hypothetical protein BDD12DRAFT_895760 [Trichophaea hybrida]
MASPPNDDAFAQRLAALKTPKKPVTSDELSTRFQQLFARSPGSPLTLPEQKQTPKNTEDDVDVEQLIDSVKGEKETWAVDGKDIDALLEEAEAFQQADEVPDWLKDDRLDAPTAEEEDEALAKIREQVEWELRHGFKDEEEEEEQKGKIEKTPGDPGDDEEDELAVLAKRFEALGGGIIGGGISGDGEGLELPAAPKAAPGAPVKITPKKEVGVSEIDTWCCICNEDAEYRCSGCDGDIYCKECLYEAHTGPDAGYEERRHKWTKYIRPKKILSAA